MPSTSGAMEAWKKRLDINQVYEKVYLKGPERVLMGKFQLIPVSGAPAEAGLFMVSDGSQVIPLINVAYMVVQPAPVSDADIERQLLGSLPGNGEFQPGPKSEVLGAMQGIMARPTKHGSVFALWSGDTEFTMESFQKRTGLKVDSAMYEPFPHLTKSVRVPTLELTDSIGGHYKIYFDSQGDEAWHHYDD